MRSRHSITKSVALSALLLFSSAIAFCGSAVSQGFLLEYAWAPKTIEELSDRSPVIVEAEVVSVFPAVEVQKGNIQTDALLRVTRDLKGSEQVTTFVVSQVGGNGRTTTQYALMVPGERYLMFLSNVATPGQKVLPVRAGTTRYQFVAGQALATFRVEGNRLHFAPDVRPVFVDSLKGKTAEQVISKVQTHLQQGTALPGK